MAVSGHLPSLNGSCLWGVGEGCRLKGEGWWLWTRGGGVGWWMRVGCLRQTNQWRGCLQQVK